MVAISLYKGALHKVPDVPRRWPRPEATISLREFKILIRRRAKTLARLQCPSDELVATSSPSSIPAAVDVAHVEYSGASPVVNHADDLASEPASHQIVDSKDGDADSKVLEVPIGEDSSGKLGMKAEEKNEEAEIHIISTEEAISEMEKSKEEIKEKLEILNEKKHSLVQVLKQILNAEEQLKRQQQPITPTPGGCPPLPPLQVDTSNESRANTPRTGPDGNTHARDADGSSGLEDSSYRHHLPRTPSGFWNSTSQGY